jgi:dephospho-CoA kinase
VRIIGLTGSFGTGKTFVASILKGRGARVIDADKIAHEVIARPSRAYKEVVRAFGASVLKKDKEIDRKKLAETVFGDAGNVKKLNRIIHPEVISRIKKEIKTAPRDKVVVIDAPLLVEAKMQGIVDLIMVVKASKDVQVERCVKKFKMSKEEVLKRIKNQMPLARKIRLADFIIDNNGRKKDTKKQIMNVWRRWYGNS